MYVTSQVRGQAFSFLSGIQITDPPGDALTNRYKDRADNFRFLKLGLTKPTLTEGEEYIVCPDFRLARLPIYKGGTYQRKHQDGYNWARGMKKKKYEGK